MQACQESGSALLTNRASPNLDCPTVAALQEATRANVENNVAALLIVGGLALIGCGVILFRDKAGGRGWALGGFLAAGVVWLCGLVALAVSVDWLAGNAHYVAAGGLLLAILLVAAANAYRRPDQRPTMMRALESPRQFYYTWVAIGMLAIAVILIALWLLSVISLFWVEILVAFLFILFWTVQTIELQARTMMANHEEMRSGEIAAA